MDQQPEALATAQPRRHLALPLTVALAVLLSACSSVPDWANPVTWYDNVFSSDQGSPKAATTAQQTAAKESGAKSSSKAFPSLRSVPEKAPQTSDAAERAKVTGGLVADRKHARYTDEKLRGGEPLPPPPPVLKAEAKAAAKTVKVARAAPKPEAKPEVKVASAAPAEVKMARATLPPPPPPSALPPAAPVKSAAPQAVPFSPRLVPRSQVKRARPAAPYPKLRGSAGAAPAPRSAAAAPAPALAPAAPAAPAPAPVVAAPAPAPAPAPLRAPTLTLRPPPPAPSAATMAALGGVQAPGQSILLQAFASGLAASAATVTTAPASPGFAAPAAPPLTTTETTASDVVRKSYNASLSASQPALSATADRSGVSRFATFGAAAIKPLAVVNFATGSAHLTTASKAKLRQIVAAHRARGGGLRVVGHASHRTRNLPLHKHKMVNFRISVDRANAVARELMRLGVQTAALRVEAVSDSKPIYFEVMPAGEAKNRRAEIFLEF
ncbi:MAG: OmpA family protein [Alphaproteobacteria bacterium]|jgi:flagellar motor protein MotB|nr:OmpA family protein [Alphaproteobacteria bacterium]